MELLLRWLVASGDGQIYPKNEKYGQGESQASRGQRDTRIRSVGCTVASFGLKTDWGTFCGFDSRRHRSMGHEPHVSGAFEIGLVIVILPVIATISLFAHEIEFFIWGEPKTEAGWKNASKETRVAVVAILMEIGLISYLAFQFAPISAPLSFFAESRLVSYLPDYDVQGIKWKSYYSELEVHVSNDSLAYDYANIDITITVNKDLVIFEAAQAGGPAKCNMLGDNSEVWGGRETYLDADGQLITIRPDFHRHCY
ncbi:MAG: hypothetical protein ABSG46_12940 [Candidatus Binataceae bacterium]